MVPRGGQGLRQCESPPLRSLTSLPLLLICSTSHLSCQ
jgi:hypothetical protein